MRTKRPSDLFLARKSDITYCYFSCQRIPLGLPLCPLINKTDSANRFGHPGWWTCEADLLDHSIRWSRVASDRRNRYTIKLAVLAAVFFLVVVVFAIVVGARIIVLIGPVQALPNMVDEIKLVLDFRPPTKVEIFEGQHVRRFLRSFIHVRHLVDGTRQSGPISAHLTVDHDRPWSML